MQYFPGMYADLLHPSANPHAPEDLVNDARDFLINILPHPDHPDFPRALYIVQFSAKHQRLRERYVALENVISALMLALERIVRSRNEALFLLLTDSLRYLIDDSACDQCCITYTLTLCR